MRHIIIDTCSLVNLHNAGALELALSLVDMRFFVSPLVIGECSGECGQKLEQLLRDGRLQQLNDDDIPASLYFKMFERYRLGDGETECLCFCISQRLIVCTDDGAARKAIQSEMGHNYLTGSLGLLRELVAGVTLSSADAFAKYRRMVDAGAFLPRYSEMEFRKFLTT